MTKYVCFPFISFFEVLSLLRMLVRLFSFLSWDVLFSSKRLIMVNTAQVLVLKIDCTLCVILLEIFYILSLSSFHCLLSLSSYLEGSFFCQGAVSIGSNLAEKKWWKLTVLGRRKEQNSLVEFEGCLIGKMSKDM